MNRALGLLFAIAVASGCGDNIQRAAITPDQLLAKLQALPGVTVREQPTEETGLRYYVLHFTQPIDHNDPSLGTFQQEVSLLHRSNLPFVPMIVHTSGYADTTLDTPVELTQLLAANQVSIEHRFFGESKPEPADWSKLTIEQFAADEHEIITSLRSIYEGAFITTGGSKGGMTAVFHRRFYPNDVDGTVAYAAPISLGAPDPRYPLYLDKIGPVPCRQAVRDVAVELLARRRTAMCGKAEGQATHTYTRVPIGPAVEAAIVGLEWTFWQYSGVALCPMVPLPTATDDALFAFLDQVSPVWGNDDHQLSLFEAYYYQSYAQLGYPDGGTGYLRPYMHYTEEDYAAELPTIEPAYDAESMRDIDNFVEHQGERLLFLYGQWDPWTGGKFALGNAADNDSALLTQPKGGHNVKIANLELSDREEAFSKLRNWTGVTAQTSRLRSATRDVVSGDLPPRIPPALVRALRAQK